MKNKSAFTMIELVFVIVVLGILASLAMGRMDRDLRQEAADSILSHIRLTQQLALRDNKHCPFTGIINSDGTLDDDKWQKAYWQIVFDTSEENYTVGSDLNLDGSIVKEESAIDPTDGKYLFNVLVEKEFGINAISKSAGCGNNDSVAFDYLGRPQLDIDTASNTFSSYMTNDCNLTFTMSTDHDNDGSDDTFVITIESETGHSFIVGQESS